MPHERLVSLEPAKQEATNGGITRMAVLLRSRFMGAGRLGRLYFSRFCDSLESLWKNFSSYARRNLDMQFARSPVLLVEVADYGIVGDLFGIVPALIEALEKSKTD